MASFFDRIQRIERATEHRPTALPRHPGGHAPDVAAGIRTRSRRGVHRKRCNRDELIPLIALWCAVLGGSAKLVHMVATTRAALPWAQILLIALIGLPVLAIAIAMTWSQCRSVVPVLPPQP
jgi:hypothetical protein